MLFLDEDATTDNSNADRHLGVLAEEVMKGWLLIEVVMVDGV